MRVIYGGGHRLEVGVAGRFEELPRTVRLSVPVDEVELTPDGARKVALGLIESAADAESRRGRAR